MCFFKLVQFIAPYRAERLSENWEIGDLITHTNYAVLVVLEVVVVVHVAIAKVHEPRVVGTAL